jgi:hypothetical protein
MFLYFVKDFIILTEIYFKDSEKILELSILTKHMAFKGFSCQG